MIVQETNNDITRNLTALVQGERDFIANASNFVALIYDSISDLNWVGFYMLTGDELILGPFQGKPACIRIELGKGVCGTSALERRAIIVDNVHEFPGHIACDAASNSEIVIPMIFEGIIYGVLDIDSPKFSRFTQTDLSLLSKLLEILLSNSDMSKIHDYYNNE
jgi:GAF domain-containing protein